MPRLLATIVLCSIGSTASAFATDPLAAQMDRYFAIWADNGRVAPYVVDRLYATHVVYYGKSMTQSEVLRDKLNFIRQWPDRRYKVVPGSVSKTCNSDQTACRISAVLSWERNAPSTRQGGQGENTIVLNLVREAGFLKIARESGSAIVQSACRDTGARWSCSAFR